MNFRVIYLDAKIGRIVSNPCHLWEANALAQQLRDSGFSAIVTLFL